MRILAVLLLVVAAVPAAAQQPEITGFTGDTLTWTNAETNVYCGVEWTMDLQYTWFPFMTSSWDVLATSRVQSATLDLDVFTAIDWVSDELNQRMDSHFFRIAVFPSRDNQVPVTNWIRILNHSTSVLQNAAIGYKTAGGVFTPYTNTPAISPTEETPSVPASEDYGPLDSIGWSSSWEGWYVAYDHDGSNRVMGTIVFPVGPPRKDVSVTVSNTGAQIAFEWLSDLKTDEPY
jgi:hypothetical protein